jgi:hypothetical protein
LHLIGIGKPGSLTSLLMLEDSKLPSSTGDKFDYLQQLVQIPNIREASCLFDKTDSSGCRRQGQRMSSSGTSRMAIMPSFILIAMAKFGFRLLLQLQIAARPSCQPSLWRTFWKQWHYRTKTACSPVQVRPSDIHNRN